MTTADAKVELVELCKSYVQRADDCGRLARAVLALEAPHGMTEAMIESAYREGWRDGFGGVVADKIITDWYGSEARTATFAMQAARPIDREGEGASPLATGLSQAEPEVSALRASIPSAMVQRVAQAMWRHVWGELGSETPVELSLVPNSTEWLDRAYAVIIAMREPTAGMREVGPYINENNPNCPPITSAQAEACWQMMIDEALAMEGAGA